MTKYALPGVTVLLVVAAIGAMSYPGRRGYQAASSPAAPPTALPSPAAARMTREGAIGAARGRAATMGEANPVLVDAFTTTLSDVRHRLRPSDGAPSDGPPPGKALVPEDARVWMVRMRGEFEPPSGPGPVVENPRRHPGWMYAVFDAEAGTMITWGLRGKATPIR